LAADEKVQISTDGTTWTDLVVTAGAWSYIDGRTLVDGNYTYGVRVVDAAGNIGSTASQLVTIDTTSPGGPGGTDAPTLTIAEAAGGIDAIELSDGIQAVVGLTPGTQAGDTITITTTGAGGSVSTHTVTAADVGVGSVSVTLDNSAAFADGSYSATAVISDTAGNSSAPSNTVNFIVDALNDAPEVFVDYSTLLGLVGLQALNVIDLSKQDLRALDRNGNLQSVVVEFGAVATVGAITLTASSALAAELGLQFDVVNSSVGSLLSLGPHSTVTITAIDGGIIDNLTINEFLASVRFDTGGSLLGDLLSASVLPDLAIAATDSYGVSSGTKTMGTLLDASLLHSLAGDSGIIEGTSGDDPLTGTAFSDRLYGYAGNDTLSGGDGNDLLRGGSGTNTLNGDGGNDILISTGIDDTLNGGTGDDFIVISDNLFAAIDGGDGFDILQMDGGFALDSTSVATVSNIELIDMGMGDAGSTLTLTADAVDTLTDADNQLYITGESNDTLNVAGAVDTGAQTTLDSVVFDVYSFGVNQLLVDQDVQVIA